MVLVVFLTYSFYCSYLDSVKDYFACLLIAYSHLCQKMRPIFCGNFEYDARQNELERLFGRYGKVDRVDMKSGELFCSPCVDCISIVVSV